MRFTLGCLGYMIQTLLLLSAGGNSALATQSLAADPEAPATARPGGEKLLAAMRYLPDSSKLVVSVDVSSLLASKLSKDAVAKAGLSFKDLEKKMSEETGLTLGDVRRFTLGGEPTAKSAFVAVVELNKDVDKDKVLQRFEKGKWTEEKVDGSVIYLSDGDPKGAVLFADHRTIVLGLASEVRSAIKRGRAAQLSGPLAVAVKQLDLSQAVAVAVAIPDHLRAMGAQALPGADVLKDIQTATLHAQVESSVRLSGTITCKEEGAAEDLAKMVDGASAAARLSGSMPKEAQEMLDSLKISRSGRNVSAELTISGDTVNRMLSPAIESARRAADRTKTATPGKPKREE